MTRSTTIFSNLALAALFLGSTGLHAHETDSQSALIADAENAMTDGDYIAGVNGYLAAANAGDSIETARQAALVAFEFGFDKLAVEATDRWVELSDGAQEAQQYHAYSVLRTGDVDRAIELMEALLAAESPTDVCGHAEETLARDARAADVAELMAALAKPRKAPACIVRLAAATALIVNEPDETEKYIERLRKSDALDNAARLIEINRLIADEQADAAFTDETLRLDDSATIEQRIELAFLNLRAEEKDNAENMISQLRLESPDDTDIMLAEGLFQLQNGDIETSRRTFLTLLTSGEKTADALYYLARFAERERRFDQAQRMYSQVEYGDYVLAAQQRVARLITERRGAEAGIAHLEDFVERHPRYGVPLSTVLAAAYSEGEYYDQALALFDQYLEIRPNAEFAMLGRADVLLQSGELDDAIDAFRGVVKQFPKSANALNALGYTLADRTNKLREAEKLIDRALEKAPENAAIIDSKGWVLFRRGRYEEALEYLEQAWEKFPDPEVAAHLGETLWKLGREEQSRELLQQAWQRFPNNDHLRKTIERLLDDGPATRS